MPFTLGGDWIPNEQPKKNSGPVKVRREKRRGKFVTVILNLDRHEDELKELGKKIRSRLGAGGTVKEGIIEIQGDLVDKVKAILKDIDPSIKLAP